MSSLNNKYKRKGSRSPSGMVIPTIPDFTGSPKLYNSPVSKPALPSYFDEALVPEDQSIIRPKKRPLAKSVSYPSVKSPKNSKTVKSPSQLRVKIPEVSPTNGIRAAKLLPKPKFKEPPTNTKNSPIKRVDKVRGTMVRWDGVRVWRVTQYKDNTREAILWGNIAENLAKKRIHDKTEYALSWVSSLYRLTDNGNKVFSVMYRGFEHEGVKEITSKYFPIIS